MLWFCEKKKHTSKTQILDALNMGLMVAEPWNKKPEKIF